MRVPERMLALAIDLSGTAVLLTGGSKGIGAATLELLARAGASVVFTYRTGATQAQDLCARFPSTYAYQCDLSDHDSLPALVDYCIGTMGAIDVLINNAAIFADNPFEGSDYGVWRRGWQHTFDVNLFGPANLAFLTMAHMRKRGRGKIINIASRAAHRGELSFADYGASKAALVNLTKSIARACARDGIIALALAPGFIETEMAREELERRRAEIEAEIPSRRVGTPQEVAGFIAFLASPMADYANGATIDMNGGSYVR